MRLDEIGSPSRYSSVKTGEDRLGLAGDAHGRGHDEFECDACGFRAGREDQNWTCGVESKLTVGA